MKRVGLFFPSNCLRGFKKPQIQRDSSTFHPKCSCFVGATSENSWWPLADRQTDWLLVFIGTFVRCVCADALCGAPVLRLHPNDSSLLLFVAFLLVSSSNLTPERKKSSHTGGAPLWPSHHGGKPVSKVLMEG